MNREPVRLRTGQKLGNYELLAPVARGSIGQVWAARLRGARGFHKLVAIKTLLPAPGDSSLMEHRLLEEARVAALVQHSNVAQTLELGEHEGALYLVMEWIDGESLDTVREHASKIGGLPLLAAINLVAQALRGLQAAHEIGIVHRDVSARSLLVSYAGIVKLVDFGITRPVTQSSYLAPEQLSGGLVDQRSDLFALGVVLYELTTGRHPFGGAPATDEAVIRPSLIKPGYSRTLEAVVLKALEKDRDRRWPSAEEMRLALQRGVPQAFELGSEAQLATFMADALGEQAQRKREALHRFELVVDAGGADSSPPSSSLTSLRAIAVDADAEPNDVHIPLAPRSVRVPRAGHRALWVGGLAAGVVAVLAALLWSRPARQSSQAASAPGAGMVELSPPREAAPAARLSAAASDRTTAPPILPSARPPAKRRPERRSLPR